MNVVADELRRQFPEIMPYEFYRSIFPDGELDEAEAYTPGKYCAIALEFTKDKKADGRQIIKRHTITDDLDGIDQLIWQGNFCAMAPISYAGKSRKSAFAHAMFALVIELDNLCVAKMGEQSGLHQLIGQWSERVHWIPCPTYIVASGTGIHLYYVFSDPVPMYPNVAQQMGLLKRELTKKIWNRKTTTDYHDDKIQYESIFQPFRVVGTITKQGDKTQAFQVGDRVTLDYLNQFVHEANRVVPVACSPLSLREAQIKYPEWYEKRIIRGEPKGRWVCNRAVYDWWKSRIEDEATVGHRYWCMLCLAVYAVKCQIEREELEADCLKLQEIFDERSIDDSNAYTEKDMLAALQAYEDGGAVYWSVKAISYKSGVEIKSNKRNGRTRAMNLRRARALQDIDDPEGMWRNKNGRPKGTTKQSTVQHWRLEHPDGRKVECIRDTGLDKKTVYKWWDSSDANPNIKAK